MKENSPRPPEVKQLPSIREEVEEEEEDRVVLDSEIIPCFTKI